MLPLMVQSVSVAVPPPRLSSTAAGAGVVAADGAVCERELYLIRVGQAAAVADGGVAADGAVGQRGVPSVAQAAAVGGGVAADGAVGQRMIVPRTLLYTPPPRVGGVAADGAVGQRGRAAEVRPDHRCYRTAELPLTVQLVSVVVPP